MAYMKDINKVYIKKGHIIMENTAKNIETTNDFAVVESVLEETTQVAQSDNKALKVLGGIVLVAGMGAGAYFGIKKFIKGRKANVVDETDDTVNEVTDNEDAE